MKTLIIETNEIKNLPRIAIESDDLLQGSVIKVSNNNYDYEMSQADFKWWCEVQLGVQIAEKKGLNTLDMEYEDYRNLL